MKTTTQAIAGITLFVGTFLASASAQVIPFTGSHAQNFNSIVTASFLGYGTPSGWTASVGSSNTSNSMLSSSIFGANLAWGYAAGSPAEWAIGVFSGNATQSRSISAKFSNQTGSALTQIYVSYDLEVWSSRYDSATPRQAGFNLEFSSDNGTTWIDMGSQFDTAISNASISSISNPYWLSVPLTTSVVSQMFVLPTSLASGGEFMLRWNAASGVPVLGGAQNRDMGAFIDNFQISTSPVPEPSTYALILGVLTGIVVFLRKRRRSFSG